VVQDVARRVEFFLVEDLRLRRRVRSRSEMRASSSALRVSRAVMWLRLQQEDLAFEIGEARSLRGLHIFDIFQGLEASEECFDIRRARIEEGVICQIQCPFGSG
jgi:hypothetical protein